MADRTAKRGQKFGRYGVPVEAATMLKNCRQFVFFVGEFERRKGPNFKRLYPRWMFTHRKAPQWLNRHEFALLVASRIERRFISETTMALCSRIIDDPTTCPILADALEEAGCDDQELLRALRTA